MKEILLHQSFHGYSEGHRLLESSIKLPDEYARLMLRMSDLSGGSIYPGFEEYLTGYPILTSNIYVFAKTWYAPEMPRPGCVWTHSLILQVKDFEDIQSLAQLSKLFVRPRPAKPDSKSPKLSGTYSTSIRFVPNPEESQIGLNDTVLAEQLRSLVNVLYASKKRNVLIPAPSSTNFENSLIRLWSQQWPTLRSNFSFCTGALSARGFAGKPFDVQCAPPQLIREITTSALAKQSQEMNVLNRETSTSEEAWADSTVFDATLPNGGVFREVLWSLSDGHKLEDFQSFARLAIRLRSNNEMPLADFITLVADSFPDKSSGLKLKNALFGEARTKTLNDRFSECEVLSELSVSEHSGAFDPELLRLRHRAKILCINSPEDAKQLISKLFRGPVNSLGEEILAGLLEAMNPEIAKKITREQPHFLPTLFRAKSELGTSAELWRAAGDHVRELFESLSSIDNLTDERITAISEAIIAGGAEMFVRRAMEKWGEPAVFGVLNYVAKSGKPLSERVIGAMTFHDVTIMKWLKEQTDRPLFAKIVCVHIVAPYSYKIKTFGSEIWLNTYEELREQGNAVEVNYLATLLLALALQNASPSPTKVIGLCFEHLHQLAWNDKMQDDNWIILDPIVPHHLIWLHDWDKCERMRRGLIEAFVKFQWPPEKLHECIKSDDLLVRILKSAKAVQGGHEYFSKFVRQ